MASTRPASRLRVWLRTANRQAVGSCLNAGRDGPGEGGAGWARSAADTGFPHGWLAAGKPSHSQVGKHVEPVLLEHQMRDDHYGLAAAAQVADHIPEPKVGLPVNP